MSRHFSSKELKNFADGNYSVSELFVISKHIAQCESCKNSLKGISSSFVTESSEDPDERSVSENEQHFSDNEITAFLKGELSIKYRLKMANHFRNCADCKTKVFQKDPKILIQTITTYLDKKETPEEKSFLSNIYALIPVGVLTVLLAGTLFYVLLVGVNSDMPNTQLAKATDINETPLTSSDISTNEKNESDNSNVIRGKSLKNNKPNNNLYLGSKNKGLTREERSITRSEEKLTPKSEIKSKINESNNSPNLSKSIFAESRSANNKPNCMSENSFITTVEPYLEKDEKQLTFRWKSVPKATKYNFYISDSSQVLVEEAELEKETSYTLKKTLEQNNSYKWLVIATLPDGETVSSLPIYFSAGKTPQKNRLKINCGNK